MFNTESVRCSLKCFGRSLLGLPRLCAFGQKDRKNSNLKIKAEFSASLLQSSVSRDPSEIILKSWFGGQETFASIDVFSTLLLDIFAESFFQNQKILDFVIKRKFKWSIYWEYKSLQIFYLNESINVLLNKTKTKYHTDPKLLNILLLDAEC